MLSRMVEGETDGSVYADFFRSATLDAAAFLGRNDLGRIRGKLYYLLGD